MNPASFPLKSVLRLLPDLEELEELRLLLTEAAVPDPQHDWSRSAAYATVDQWTIDPTAMANSVNRAEAAVHERVAGVFEAYRDITEAIACGEETTALRRLIDLGAAEEERSRFDRAERYLEIALAASLPASDKEIQILALRRMARVLRSQGDLTRSLAYYERSEELAVNSGDARSEVSAKIGRSTILGHQGRWSEMEQVCREALELTGRVDGGMLLERGHIYNNLIASETRQGRFDRAERWCREAQSIWEQVDSPTDRAICHFNIAVLRKRQGRMEEALECYEKALAVRVGPQLRALMSTDLAAVHSEAGRESEASKWAREAETQAIASRSPYALGHLYRGFGNIYRGRNDWNGFVFYEKSLEIARERGLRLLEGETLIDYAQLRARMGEVDEARSYLEAAKEIFEDAGALAEHARAQQTLESLAEPPPGADPVLAAG